MDEVKILIFDEEELTITLIEKYLKEVIFPFKLEKYSVFNSKLINNCEKQIIILNLNKYNLECLADIKELLKQDNIKFVAISYDNSTDLRVKAIKSGVSDFLLKPIIKNDFIYCLNQIHKTYFVNSDNKINNQIFSVTSLKEGEGKTTFTINTAEEIAYISKKNVLILDIINSEKNISDILNIQANSKEKISLFENKYSDINVPSYKNSSLFVLQCPISQISDETIENFENNIKILKNKFPYIFICMHLYEANELFNYLTNLSNEIFYIVSEYLAYNKKLKTHTKKLRENKTVNIVLNMADINNHKNINDIQTQIGSEIEYIIPKHFKAVEKALLNRKALNDINRNYDISQTFYKTAQSIINRY